MAATVAAGLLLVGCGSSDPEQEATTTTAATSEPEASTTTVIPPPSTTGTTEATTTTTEPQGTTTEVAAGPRTFAEPADAAQALIDARVANDEVAAREAAGPRTTAKAFGFDLPAATIAQCVESNNFGQAGEHTCSAETDTSYIYVYVFSDPETGWRALNIDLAAK